MSDESHRGPKRPQKCLLRLTVRPSSNMTVYPVPNKTACPVVVDMSISALSYYPSTDSGISATRLLVKLHSANAWRRFLINDDGLIDCHSIQAIRCKQAKQVENSYFGSSESMQQQNLSFLSCSSHGVLLPSSYAFWQSYPYFGDLENDTIREIIKWIERMIIE